MELALIFTLVQMMPILAVINCLFVRAMQIQTKFDKSKVKYKPKFVTEN